MAAVGQLKLCLHKLHVSGIKQTCVPYTYMTNAKVHWQFHLNIQNLKCDCANIQIYVVYYAFKKRPYLVFFHFAKANETQYFGASLSSTCLTFHWSCFVPLRYFNQKFTARCVHSAESSRIAEKLLIGGESAVCLLGVNSEAKKKSIQAITRLAQAHLECAPCAHSSNLAKMLSENPCSSSLQTP